MANTIDSYSGNSAISIASNRSTPSQRDSSLATTDNAQSGTGNPEVQITSTAAKLASLGKRLGALPAINQDRVAQISRALANGTYSVSADKIAGGLLQSDLGLAQIGL